VTNEYLAPKGHDKPHIKVGNYFLKWEVSSNGISRREAAELKRFVSDLVPYLSTSLLAAANGIQKGLNENLGAKEARRFEEAFSPRLLITRKIDDIVYELNMNGDGTTIISRNEIIMSEGNKTELTLSWNLGELLFDRQH